MEQVAAAGKDCPLLMFNIYIFRDRGFTSRVLRSMPLHHDQLCIHVCGTLLHISFIISH